MLTLNLSSSHFRFSDDRSRFISMLQRKAKQRHQRDLTRAHAQTQWHMQTKAHRRRQSETTNHLFSGLPKLERMKMKKRPKLNLCEVQNILNFKLK
jgi:hypothetical protein